jgi:dTDP-4-dehydrorhamnose 3,5-epimerase
VIHDVIITPLRQIIDERGKVMHMLRRDSKIFQDFGEIYFSCVYPGAIKGWHFHKRMTLNYAVPYGRIRLVIYDDRSGSPSKGKIQEICLGPDNYCLVTIPPCIWSGFKGIGTDMAIVANCATLPHNPDETDHLDTFDTSIPYDWRVNQK